MSSIAGWAVAWSTKKTVALTGHTLHKHKPSPVSPGFKSPVISTLSFGPTALAAAIARTATLQGAPVELLARFRDRALIAVEYLIEEGAPFALSPNLRFLADAERTAFAGQVGAGITDIFMNALGYTWRDNAACVSSSLDPHADFIYGGGYAVGHGVVLVEAHGSFAANVTSATIGRRAKDKYLRQVRPWVASTYSHGLVVHGYSVAFGSKPGAPGSYLSLAETRITKVRRRPPIIAPSEILSEAQSTQTSMALASHRSNFTLMGSPRTVTWIDWARGSTEYPDVDSTTVFLRLPYARRSFLACLDRTSTLGDPLFWWERFGDYEDYWRYRIPREFIRRHEGSPVAGWFVMEEKCCEKFLNALSGIIRTSRDEVPAQLELPSIDPVGFGVGDEGASLDERDSDYTYALFRDGLALLRTPPRRIDGIRIWSPQGGLG